jgi:hypothetical protein
MAERFVIGGPLRLIGGLLLAGLSGLLVSLGYRLGWGMPMIFWVPAMILLLPAFHLVRRIVLVADGGHIDLESGFLFRRSWRFALTGGELEIVPTAGLRTVVLHKGGHEIPLAAWLTAGRAEALCAFIDAAPGGPLTRRAPRRPEADR